MAQVDSYLFFDGNCAEAMRFYEKALGGKLEAVMTYADSPDESQCPPGAEGKVMHASLVLDGDRRLMASDDVMTKPFEKMQGFALSLFYAGADDARRAFDELAAGGTVKLPMGKTFWAEAFGMLVDRFGTPWMVSGGESKG